MELPRGMKDFVGKENADIEFLRSYFKNITNLYGYSFMDPSPIELLSTLEIKSGPGIRDEIYYFKDKGDREVALRFDFTMGLTRYVTGQKSMKLPAKIAAFGGVFRYDEPQKGRYRYFHQWDIEVYGKANIETDVEIIEITSRFFDLLQLKDITIDVNHRNLVESYINKIFNSKEPKLVADILRAIDKIAKKPKEQILKEFQDKGYETQKLEKILEFAQIKGTVSEIKKAFDTSQLESWNELVELIELLNIIDVNNVRINFGIVRGLDYYSGLVFEVFDENSTLGALAGGGRYDTLTRAFGRDDIGAAGVAGGVERIILTMKEQGLNYGKYEIRVAILYTDSGMQRVATTLATTLRLQNIPTDMDLAGRSIKKQMDIASLARYVIIVGQDEFANREAVLKDMKNGTERIVSLNKLIEDARSVLNLEKRPS